MPREDVSYDVEELSARLKELERRVSALEHPGQMRPAHQEAQPGSGRCQFRSRRDTAFSAEAERVSSFRQGHTRNCRSLSSPRRRGVWDFSPMDCSDARPDLWRRLAGMGGVAASPSPARELFLRHYVGADSVSPALGSHRAFSNDRAGRGRGGLGRIRPSGNDPGLAPESFPSHLGRNAHRGSHRLNPHGGHARSRALHFGASRYGVAERICGWQRPLARPASGRCCGC